MHDAIATMVVQVERHADRSRSGDQVRVQELSGLDTAPVLPRYDFPANSIDLTM